MIRCCITCHKEYVASGKRASVLWCAECDAARIKRLDEQFKQIQAQLNGPQPGDSDGIAPKSRG